MSPWIHVAGWTLVQFVWQGALVGLAAAALLRLLRAASAQVRHAAACSALAAMLAAPVMTARLLSVSDVAGVQIDPLSSAPSRDTAADAIALLAAPSPARHGLSLQAVRVGLDAILPLVVAAWFAGVAFLLIRFAGGWWRVRRLHHEALAMVASRWQAASERIAVRLGLRRAVNVVDSPLVDTPTALGWLRPVVLLPIAALTNLTPAQVEAVLAHELAHIRRHDYLINLLQTLAETLLFYHPAVWWVSARIRAEREHRCDDDAVRVCGDAVGYASALAELETWRIGQPSALALAATDGALLERVRRVLQVPVKDARQSSSAALTAAIVLLLIVVAGSRNHLPAQTPPSPAFEAASVKPTRTQGTTLLMFYPGGRLTATNVGLGWLIRRAYRLQDNQLVGGPSWIQSESFDIEAKAEGNASSQQLLLMLQTLLTERFKLILRRETRELPFYALVMAKAGGEPGPQLRPSSGSDCVRPPLPGKAPNALADSPGSPCGLYSPMGHWVGRGTTIDSLGSELSRVTSRVVVNRTGLTGTFNLDLQWTDLTVLLSPTGSPADPPPPGDGPSFFTALQEQLGLKLESTKGPVEVLVIDQAEQPSLD